MTNREALNIFLPQLKHLEAAYFGVDPKKVNIAYAFDISKIRLTDKYVHFLQRNIRILGRVERRWKTIFEDFEKAFKKKEKIDESKLGDKEYKEEADRKYNDFLNLEAQVSIQNSFLNAEVPDELWLLDESEAEKSIIPVEFKELFSVMYSNKEGDVKIISEEGNG